MRKVGFLIAAIFALASCNKSNVTTKYYDGMAQGTTYHIIVVAPDSVDFRDEIGSIFTGIDNSLSTYQESSIISRINRNDSNVVVDEYFKSVYNRSVEIAKETNGDFDATVAPLVNAWGFGVSKNTEANDSLINVIKQHIGYTKAHLNGNTLVKQDSALMFDFNAIAQGYTVDVLAEFLEQNGVETYYVEVGGELRTKGKKVDGKKWTTGIDKPTDHAEKGKELQVIIQTENQAVATSGNYRKFYIDDETGAKYSHTIDPHTGYPVKHRLLSATVVADNCMDADAYATALMVMGVAEAQEFLNQKENLEGYLVYTDKKGTWQTYVTKGFEKMIKQ